MRAARYLVVIAHLVIVSALFAALTYDAARAGKPGSDGEQLGQRVEDAWIAGKLESAYLLNEHLNPFDIHIKVENGVVQLSGAVGSDIQKELAGRIAEGVEGASDVRNELTVKPRGGEPPGEQEDRGFGQWVSDATTTAVVKTKLAANEHIDSLSIEVETTQGVVTLNGRVESAEARTLAEVIASNSRNVKRVENELVVEPAGRPSSSDVSTPATVTAGAVLM